MQGFRSRRTHTDESGTTINQVMSLLKEAQECC